MYKNPIGFKVGTDINNKKPDTLATAKTSTKPKKSLVDIYFPYRRMTLPYYNDKFDLHKGDIVYVDGKLEGLQGQVVRVNYSFKIKLSDYKRVVAVADTSVKGDFYIAGSHIVTFDPNSLPYEKVLLWFKAPCSEDEEYAVGDRSRDKGFSLETLDINIKEETADSGKEYYMDSRVVYICVENTHGRAIVEGKKPYEIEFDLAGGIVNNLVCSCYCSYNCKHEFAAMLQLRETLKFITDNYQAEYKDYFAAILKNKFFKFTVDKAETGKITL